MKTLYSILIILIIITASACSKQKDSLMFIDKIEKLIQTKTENEEEVALGNFLTSVRHTDFNYGYRVFNITKDKRVLPEEIDDELDDELLVTIFVGKEAPYQEFKWKPKYNGHITRLIMP